MSERYRTCERCGWTYSEKKITMFKSPEKAPFVYAVYLCEGCTRNTTKLNPQSPPEKQ